MSNNIINIIVAGTGGQGVVTLSNLIRKLAMSNGFACEGATFKGGAQRMGTVYSALRIRMKNENQTVFSSQIPKGEVHVLLGLEPWETLRFASLCNKNTKVISHTVEEKLYVERINGQPKTGATQQLKALFEELILLDFSTNTKEKINIQVLKKALTENYLPFNLEQLKQIM
jgi:Pyruvate/2-oxoacid:ferredoxin oxidoreductase gamma subunit